MTSPLRTRRDYGSGQGAVNPYLNTPPTVLKKKLKTVKDEKQRKLIRDALNAYRTTYGNPLLSKEIKKIIVLLRDSVKEEEDEDFSYQPFFEDPGLEYSEWNPNQANPMPELTRMRPISKKFEIIKKLLNEA